GRAGRPGAGTGRPVRDTRGHLAGIRGCPSAPEAPPAGGTGLARRPRLPSQGSGGDGRHHRTIREQRAHAPPRPPPANAACAPPPAPNSLAERDVVERLVRAYEAGNVSALVSLLTEDVVITAPLAGGKYVGTAVATRLFETVIFPEDRTYRLIPTRANGQPAFGVYVLDPATGAFHVNGMLVLTLAGNRISAMTRFDNSLIARF